jgi:hypothetical protein
MIPKKPAPDLIRGGNRFSEKIMLKQKLEPDCVSTKNDKALGKTALWIAVTVNEC